jgi:hypothetical protein
MLIYWIIFLIPALLALSGNKRTKTFGTNYSLSLDFFWFLVLLFLTSFIGLRYEVGGDWHTYILILSRSIDEGFSLLRDPSYVALNKLSSYLGFGIYGVNLICAFIFSLGLIKFCKNLPRSFLALAISIPYLVIVVSMGYTRQAVALGICMYGFVILSRGHLFKFICLVLFAVTIHKSSMIFIPIAALSATKNKLVTILGLLILTIFTYFIFLAETFDIIYKNYIESEQQSQGAFVRLFMNLVPAVLFLVLRKRFKIPREEKSLWTWFSMISIFLFFSYFLTDASTAIDRIALYMLPLQLFVFGYLPDLFKVKGQFNDFISFCILIYYGLTLFVWLNFATHSFAWVPYTNIISETVFELTL